MITTGQIKAARAILRWKASDLADMASVGVATIRRIELQNGIPVSHDATLHKVKNAFELAGIDFVGSPETNPGVQLDTKKHQAYLESLK